MKKQAFFNACRVSIIYLTVKLPVHDRMPVLLSAEEIRPWIRGENVREILSRVSSEVLVRSET